MFVKIKRQGYTATGNQIASGRFLIMMQPEGDKGNGPIRCLVRFTALKQMGHWMMGFVRVKGHRLTVSGSYGSDGLPMTVPQEVFDMGIELPADLYEKWSKGGGHNSAGNEADDIRAWAIETFKVK